MSNGYCGAEEACAEELEARDVATVSQAYPYFLALPPPEAENRANIFDMEDIHGNGADLGEEAQDHTNMPMESIKLPLAVHQIIPAPSTLAADHPDESNIEECANPEELNLS